MEPKKQVIAILGGLALGVATGSMAEEPTVEAMPMYEGNSPYTAPGYQNPYATPYGAPGGNYGASYQNTQPASYSAPGGNYGTNYPKPLSPSQQGLLNNEEDSPDNIYSVPMPKQMGPAEQAIQYDNWDGQTDYY